MTKSPKKTPAAKSAPVKLSVVSVAEQVPAEAPAFEAAPEMTPELAPGAEFAPADASPALSVQVKKKDFIERVTARSGVKKPVARDLTEVVLAVLGEALEKGETLVLPPFGKLSVARATPRTGGRAGGEVLHLKLKRMAAGERAKKAEDSAEDPLAETGE
jgi:nucleoid DNA-binding protein